MDIIVSKYRQYLEPQQSLTNNNNLRMKLTKELLVMRNLSLAVLFEVLFLIRKK